MTYGQVVERQHGALGALLIVEGLEASFATSDWMFPNTLVSDQTLATRHLPQQYKGFLDEQSVQWTYGIDYRSGDLRMPSVTFTLKDLPVRRAIWERVEVDDLVVWQVTGSRYIKYGITDLASGVARANLAQQRANATVGATSVTVDATAGFDSAGVIYWEQEVCVYTGLAAGPARFTGLTRGAFHSEARRHIYDPRDMDRVDDIGWEPFLTSYPVSWKGRRIQLWLAEAVPGVGTVAKRRWNGKVKSLQVQPDGVTWELQCESLWEAQRAQICTGLPKTRLRGMAIDDTTVSWLATNNQNVFVQDRLGEFTVPRARYDSARELLTAFVNALNVSIVADGIVDAFYAGGIEDGLSFIRQVDPQGIGFWDLWISIRDEVLQAFFGTGQVFVNANSEAGFVGGPVPDFLASLNVSGQSVISVDSTEDFIDTVAQGVNYRMRPGVIIGDQPFVVDDVDAGNNRMTVSPLFDQQHPGTFAVTPDDAGVVAVQGCMILTGVFPYIWQGFLEDADIPERWRIGLRTSDWDWDEIAAYSPGGVGTARGRIIDKPLPLRDMVIEDLRFAGMVPAISDASAQLSGRGLGPPSEAISVGALNQYSHDLEKLPRLTYAEDLVISGLHVEATRLGWGNAHEQQFDISIDSPGVAALFGGAELLEMKTDALFRPGADIGADEFAGHVALLAAGLLEMFGTPAWLGDCPCTIRPALLLPGDSAHLTHATWVDPDTGTRGITDSLCLVTEIQVRPFRAATNVKVWVPGNPARRGGWAPIASIIAATDDGPGAGAARYRLTVDPGAYGGAEGLWFLEGMLVVLSQYDSTAPLTETLEISSAQHNAAGTSIYVTTMPMNDPSIGTWRLWFQDYDTVGQTDAAQEYDHVADESDFLIGATTDRGFKPS